MTTLSTRVPAHRVPDAMAAPPLRWGILGTGWIAERFVSSVRSNTRQEIVAVGSRERERADLFAQREEIARSCSSYEALVSDKGIDVVYVATTHDRHLEGACMALRAGKHVLVEKPLALNAAQGAEIVKLAREEGLFCMEALWTFFLPKFDVVRQIVDLGLLGDVRSVVAEYGAYFGPEHRIMRLELGGGPLLDLGTYPVSFVTWVLGEPEHTVARGQEHPSGVNGQVAAILSDAHGNQGIAHTTLYSNTPTGATIAGTEAVLELPGPFFQPGELVLRTAGGQQETIFTEPHVGHQALYFEVAEAARCISDGKLESAVRPLSDSLVTLRAIDEVRLQCGIRFPIETVD